MKNFTLLLFLFIIFYIPHSFGVTNCEASLLKIPEQKIPNPSEDPFFLGLEEAYKMLDLGKKIRERKDQARTTHIEEFVPQISLHYEYFKNAMQIEMFLQEINNIRLFQQLYDKKLSTLDFLYQEAIKKAQNKKLTYHYWLLWNIRLAKLASITNHEIIEELKDEYHLYNSAINEQTKVYKESIYKSNAQKPHIQEKKIEILELLKREALSKVQDNQFNGSYWNYYKYLCRKLIHTDDIRIIDEIGERYSKYHKYSRRKKATDFITKISKSIDHFPQLIILPTTKNLGIIALNVFTNGVAPLGLGYLNSLVDGNRITPFDFMSHDLNHHHVKKFGYPTSILKWEDDLITREEFHKTFFEVTQDYPIKKYKQAHLAYFLLEHESDIVFKDPKYLSQQLQTPAILKRFENKDDLGLYLPAKIDRKSIKALTAYLSNVAHTYTEAVNQALEKINHNP